MENLQNSKKPENEPKSKALGYMVAEAGIEFAVMIGLPLYLFILLGKWLDQKYHKSYLVIICIFAAIALSSFMIYKKINSYKKLIK